MQMSVTRGLAELKLLADRIEKTIEQSKYVALKNGDKPVNGYKNDDEFKGNAKSNYDSVMALIKRRQAIKSAIVQSNATTNVVIGGVTMTVAEAIERKGSISLEKQLLEELSDQYNSVLLAVQRENVKVQERLDKLVESSFGQNTKVRDDQYESIAKPFLEKNEASVVDPLDAKSIIAKLSASIAEFEAEVDFTLSTSNAITMITIPD